MKRNSKIIQFILLVLCSLMILNGYSQVPNYELVWSDEFELDGAIDPEKWHQQTELPNGDSWYNGEIQHYTNRLANTFISDGTMKIVAKKETFTYQGVTKEYTSARLNSKFAFTYGKVEVRAKLPSGMGTWPAIWTLGINIIETGAYWSPTNGQVSWPACGEIDIMEHWGINPNYVQSATHTPSSFGATVNLGGQNVSDVANEFHIYSLEWTSEKLVFSVDDVVHYTYEPSEQNNATWPFDAHQYLLLNIAILPEIDPSYTESSMEVDYVRVYQETNITGIDDLSESEIPIFSNPVEKECVVQVPQKYLGSKLTIYSLTGSEVGIFELNEPKTILDFSALEKGIYTLKVQKGLNLVTTKILKI